MAAMGGEGPQVGGAERSYRRRRDPHFLIADVRG